MARKTAAKTAQMPAQTTIPATRREEIAPAGHTIPVTAHLVTGEDIKSALISSDDELDVEFEGDDPRDQHATVTTDDRGVLTWSLILETAFAHASWRLTLTRSGSAEGPPDAAGTTDEHGRARPVPSAITSF